MKHTLESWTAIAKKKHGDKYDYLKVVYINNATKIEIICKIHNKPFWQRPSHHTRGQGCPLCAHEKTAERTRSTTEEFLEKAKKLHGDEFTYPKGDFYRTNQTKIKLTCSKGHTFVITPSNHLVGHGCEQCHRDKHQAYNIKSYEYYVEKAKAVHGDRYEYLPNPKYKNALSKLKIHCPKHNKTFYLTITSHLNGVPCPICKKEALPEINRKRALSLLRYTQEEVIEKFREVHKNRYDYSKVEYKKLKTHVTIICKKHGEFSQRPNIHLQGKGCPTCNSSRGETAVANWLTEHGFEFKRETSYPDCRDKGLLRFDFEVQTKNGIVLIEYNGKQHYEPIAYFGGQKRFETNQRRDRIKKAWAKKKGLPLLVIPYNRHADKLLVKFLNV